MNTHSLLQPGTPLLSSYHSSFFFPLCHIMSSRRLSSTAGGSWWAVTYPITAPGSGLSYAHVAGRQTGGQTGGQTVGAVRNSSASDPYHNSSLRFLIRPWEVERSDPYGLSCLESFIKFDCSEAIYRFHVITAHPMFIGSLSYR